MQVAWLLICLSAVAIGSLEDSMLCGKCLDLMQHGNCSLLGVCGTLHANSCEAQHCDPIDRPAQSRFKQKLSSWNANTHTVDPNLLNLRVTKGLGSKGYDAIRVSQISKSAAPYSNMSFFDYSAQFKWHWTDNYLHTSMIQLGDQLSASINLGDQTSVRVKLPKAGEGIAGVFIADPCTKDASLQTFLSCKFAKDFQTKERLPGLLNLFVGTQSDVSFWGVLGDVWYDRTGEPSDFMNAQLNVSVKEKLLLNVLGNHEYWIFGDKDTSSTLDQCGNGFVQYYGMDTMAGKAAPMGESPYDLSVDPRKGHLLVGCNEVAMSNTFSYHQVGNAGFILYSGFYSYNQTKPYFEEACAWADAAVGLDVLILLGHWNDESDNCAPGMSVPAVHVRLGSEVPGCMALELEGRFKHITGHTHCNNANQTQVGKGGAIVAGFGMQVALDALDGCGTFGVPLVDTTQERYRIWYFGVQDIKPERPFDNYDEIVQCIRKSGSWRLCTHLATLWYNDPIPTRTIASPIGAD